MPLLLRIVLIIITLIYVFIVIKSIRKNRLQVSFTGFWIVTVILLIIALISPDLVRNISKLLGFEVTANMVFFVTIFVAFYLIFNLTISLSKECKKNISLIQEISILKKKVDELEKKSR